MRNTLAIAWREIRAYFTSPLAYVVIGIFLLLSGFIYWSSLVHFSELCLSYGNNPYYMNLLNVNDMVIRPLFGSMAVIFLLVIPVISMRTLAEERKNGTAELLFTCPVTSTEVVAGKFLGSAFVIVVMLAATLTYPLIIISKSNPDLKPAFVGYLGVLLLALSLLGIGILISSMTENQIVAAVGAFGVFLMLWALNWAAEAATSVTLAGLADKATLGLWSKLGLGIGGPTLADLLNEVSITQRMQDFRKGVLDTGNIVFYLSVVFLSLFLTQRVVESQRWR